PAPGCRLDVSRPEPLAALGAGELGMHGVATVAVAHLDGRSRGPRHPTVAPRQEGDDDRVEVAALLGEAVLEAVGALGVLAAFEHAAVDEALEAVGQYGTGCFGAGLEVLEPARAHEGLPEHKHR